MLEVPLTTKVIPILLAGIMYFATIIPFPTQTFDTNNIKTTIEDHGNGLITTWTEIPDNSITKSIFVSIITDGNKSEITNITVYRKNKTYSYVRPSMGHDPSEDPNDIEIDNLKDFYRGLTDSEKQILRKIVPKIKDDE